MLLLCFCYLLFNCVCCRCCLFMLLLAFHFAASVSRRENVIIVVSDENPTAKSVILSAMQEWEQSSCLKFVRRTTETILEEKEEGKYSCFLLTVPIVLMLTCL